MSPREDMLETGTAHIEITTFPKRSRDRIRLGFELGFGLVVGGTSAFAVLLLPAALIRAVFA